MRDVGIGEITGFHRNARQREWTAVIPATLLIRPMLLPDGTSAEEPA